MADNSIPIQTVTPLLIGPRNCWQTLGFPWRWVARNAVALGVRFVGTGRKRAVVAQEFIEALSGHPVTPPTDEAHGDDPPPGYDSPEAVRAELRRMQDGA